MNTAQSSLFRYIREKKSGQNLVDGDAVFLELFTRALPPELDRPILSGAFFFLFVVLNKHSKDIPKYQHY